MPRLSLWNSNKNEDFRFIDNACREQFTIGGTAVLVHKRTGVAGGDPKNPTKGQKEKEIQDLFFLENRDNVFDPNIYELRGHFQLNDLQLDLKQFGLMLGGDDLQVEVHENSMIEIVGRRIQIGDVIELPCMRDDALLDDNAQAINRFYRVEDASHPSNGYSFTWFRHIWRLSCSHLVDSVENAGVLDQEIDENGGTLRDLLSDYNQNIMVNDAIVAEAEAEVPTRFFDTRQLYIKKGSCGWQNPGLYFGADGVPPNDVNIRPVIKQNHFPAHAEEGDWLLHTGYSKETLFTFINSVWRRMEINWADKWTAGNADLDTFINNRNITTLDNGTQVPEKQALSKIAKPKADF